MGSIKTVIKPEVVVVDNFLSDPGAIRELALAQTFSPSDYHKGMRSPQILSHIDKGLFEDLLRRRITRWEDHAMNGRFQFCVSSDPIVYHSDLQSHAGIIFLSPQAPVECGLSLYRSKVTGCRRAPADPMLAKLTYEGNLLDRTKWELIDKIGNLYNRLVLWDGQLVHAPSCYFGNTLRDGRLFQIFFFDSE